MPAGLKGWEQAGGEVPAAYKVVFMECRQEAALADAQTRAETAPPLLGTAHGALRRMER